MEFFIDTSSLIQYAPIDQIDWNELVGGDTVTIIFAPVTINELEKHKRSLNPRASKKAKALIKKLKEVGLNGALTEKLDVKIITERPPDLIYDEYSLDKIEQDDRFIASVIKYKETNPAIAVVSNDFGITSKCQRLHIPVVELPDKYELPEEEDDLAKENKRLKEQINRLQHSAPKLALIFNNDLTYLKIKQTKADFARIKRESLLRIRQEHPHLEKLPATGPLQWKPLHWSDEAIDKPVCLKRKKMVARVSGKFERCRVLRFLRHRLME